MKLECFDSDWFQGAVFVLIILLMALPPGLAAQESEDESFTEEIVVTARARVEKPISFESNPDAFFYLLQDIDWEDPESDLEREFAGLLQDMVRHERSKFRTVNTEFWWHRIASRISFFIAHFLLLVGLLAGGIELRRARRLRAKRKDSEAIEVTIGLEGVALKNATVGFALIAISFIFYLFYLRYIYGLAPL